MIVKGCADHRQNASEADPSSAFFRGTLVVLSPVEVSTRPNGRVRHSESGNLPVIRQFGRQ